MQYKTIVLHLLQNHPQIHDQLTRTRQLIPTLEQYASELKTRHEALKNHLFFTKPVSNENQIASEALEMAIRELKDCLHFESPLEENEAASLEGAMVFIRRHMQPE